MRHIPLWFDRYPKSRRPSYPRLRGTVDTQVVIVGGGLTGAACAASLSAAGIAVVLLESDTLGAAATAGEVGLLREGFAGSFRHAAETCGLRVARGIWDAVRRGGLDLAAAVRRHAVRCNLAPAELLTFARADQEAIRSIRKEYDTRRDAGVEGSWTSPAVLSREAALETGGGLRTRGFVIDPYRACLGLAGVAASRGAAIHERSAVRRIRNSKKHVEVATGSGFIRAEWVIVTTGSLIADLAALRRHLRPEHSYGVVTEPLPAAVRRSMGRRAAVLEDASSRGMVRWLSDDRVLVHGGRQPLVGARARERALAQRTGQLMYELLLLYPDIAGLQPEWSWDRIEYETADGLPIVGAHRMFPRHFFAFGSSRHGAGVSWLAARMALRFVQGEPLKADEFLGFSRIV